MHMFLTPNAGNAEEAAKGICNTMFDLPDSFDTASDLHRAILKTSVSARAISGACWRRKEWAGWAARGEAGARRRVSVLGQSWSEEGVLLACTCLSYCPCARLVALPESQKLSRLAACEGIDVPLDLKAKLVTLRRHLASLRRASPTSNFFLCLAAVS